MYHEYDMNKILAHIRSAGRRNFILDTDTFNELDDQFAIAYAALADNVNLLALTAAPFLNDRVSSAQEGMEKSYEEMVRVRDLIVGDSGRQIPCYRGSSDYLKNIITPQHSEAADNIIRVVHESQDIVYIGCIGCYTNLASALLLDPSIMHKLVVLMVGANKFEHQSANEFNLMQDRAAARVIFECGVPVVVLPAVDCTERLYTTTGEVLYYLNDRAGEIGRYLCGLFLQDESIAEDEAGNCFSRQRSIWDLAAIAFLRDPDGFCNTHIVPVRTVDARGYWRDLNDGRHMLYVDRFDRNALFSDFFTVLRKGARRGTC